MLFYRVFADIFIELFDADGSGGLDFREFFIRISLLLSGSHKQRLECAYSMLEVNDGRLDLSNLEFYLNAISLNTVREGEIAMKAVQILEDVDVNETGTVSFGELIRWQGKASIYAWVDELHATVGSNLGIPEDGVERGPGGIPVNDEDIDYGGEPIDQNRLRSCVRKVSILLLT